MRFGFTGELTGQQTKALVLGSRVSSNPIVQDLARLGFDAMGELDLASRRLASPTSEGGVEALRSLLREFRERAGPPVGSAAHLVHPGVGPWAESPALGQLCQEQGLAAICPPAKVVSLFSNKLSLLTRAESLGIPHLALGMDPLHSVREVQAFVGGGKRPFPLVLKSVRGSTRHGVQVLHSMEDLEGLLPLWMEQLERNAGEVILLVERYLEGARRITVPFVRFHDGRSKVFPCVDASLQSRHRKIIEFCPAENVDPAPLERMRRWTLQLAEVSGFVGVGSLDFFVDDTRVFLIEGAARLNTSYRLWERVAGTSAVAWQLQALQGGPGKEPAWSPEPSWSSGVSLRIHAEDPVLQLPQPGTIREVSTRREWRFPRSEAFLEFSVEAGSVVAPDSDGLLGVVYAGASDRQQAMLVGRGVLDELWIAGSLQTNERFLAELLKHPWIAGGMYHAGFLEEEFVPEVRPAPELLHWMVAAAARAHASRFPALVTEPGVRWAVGDQWVKADPEFQESWVQEPSFFEENGLAGLSGVAGFSDGRKLKTLAFPLQPDKWLVRVGGWVLSVRRSSAAARAQGPTRSRSLLALVSGRVHSLLYREQTPVPAHEPLLVLESLSLLVPHALPVDTQVVHWKVEAEEEVRAGQVLAVFETLKS